MSGRFLPGQVISYPYLWARQHERGETGGRKSRATCVVTAVRGARDGLTHLALLGITTQPPTSDRAGLEVQTRSGSCESNSQTPASGALRAPATAGSTSSRAGARS